MVENQINNFFDFKAQRVNVSGSGLYHNLFSFLFSSIKYYQNVIFKVAHTARSSDWSDGF